MLPQGDVFATVERAEPNPEINGNISILAAIIENPNLIKASDLIVYPNYTSIVFDKKNLTNGYEVMLKGGFYPSETELDWYGYVKIPISETETLVKPITAFSKVFEIIDYPETNSKEYRSYDGTLIIGDARWEPVGMTYTIINNSKFVVGIFGIVSSDWFATNDYLYNLFS